jgi:uncharacterized protein YlxP (DUF503 family)
MMIGALSLTLRLYAADSLKEKRWVLQSVKKRLTQRFNVAVAEVGGHDLWREAQLGIVTVGRQKHVVDKVLDAVTRFLDGDARFEVVERTVEYF